MIISEALKSWRKERGMTIREAARIAGVDQSAWFRLENGKSINEANLATIICWLLS